MNHPDFQYVDLAVGGATKRNNIVKLDSLPIPKDAKDCYTGMFRFKEEYHAHVKDTGSVRGADQFECYSDYLWFDIDAEDLQDAVIDMQALLRGLRSMEVLDDTVVFFSGSKGFHVGVNAGLFGFVPCQSLPDQMRRTAIQIASIFNVDTLDTRIYNHNRLWRVVNTLHGKTSLRKTEIDTKIALDLEVSDIKKLASKVKGRGGPRHVVCDKSQPFEPLQRLTREASVGVVEKDSSWEVPPLSKERTKSITAGIDYLLEHGVGRGARDNEALLRASECRKVGVTRDDCLSKLGEWNLKNSPPLDINDLTRVVDSAYTGPGYDFGTNHDSLRLARQQSKRMMEEIDIDKLLEHGGDNDNEKHDKRPHTLAELTAGGYEPNAPQLVGEYFSWRKRITLLVGREKYSGKSTLCTFEALAALKQGFRVMWVSPDEPQDDIIYRFVKAGAMEYADQVVIASDQNTPSSWKELAEFMVDSRPDIIILDSIHSLLPLLNDSGRVPDSSESAEWQKLVARLRPLAIALDASIVWIHHATKATNLSAGSIGITAAVDAIVNVSNVRKENRRVLSYLGRRVNSSLNCAIDYLGEEQGYERVKDWSANVQGQHDQKSKSETVFTWLQEFLSTVGDSGFTRVEAATAYRDHFKEDPEVGRALSNALTKARDQNLIGRGKQEVGKTQHYTIANLTSVSDLTGGNDDEE